MTTTKKISEEADIRANIITGDSKQYWFDHVKKGGDKPKNWAEYITKTNSTNSTNSTTSTNSTSSTKIKENKKHKGEIKVNAREYLIKSFLANESKERLQAKYGIKEDIFYFSTTFDDAGTKIPAVVTSDRKIYFSQKDKADELKDNDFLFRYEFEPDALDNKIRNKAISRFIESKESVSIPEIYAKLVQLNRKYMHYVEEVHHEIAALDIIGSYFLPCFQSFGRTFLEAEKGSGKTRQCQIFKNLCCNSCMTSDISKSAFFRLLESTVGTLIIDDFDDINEEQKSDILQHYKTGYKNASKSLRAGESSRNGTRKIDSFRNYGHCIMNNTLGIDDVAGDRSKYMRLLKSEHKVTLNEINSNDLVWKNLSDDLYICALCNWKKVYDRSEKTVSQHLRARQFEIIKPLLCVSSFVSKELTSRIEAHFVKVFQEQKSNMVDDDWGYLGLVYIYSNFSENNRYPLDLVTTHVFDISVDSGIFKVKEKKRGISIYLGRMLNSLPIFTRKMINGRSHIILNSKEKLREYMEMKGWLDEVEEVELVEDVELKRGVPIGKKGSGHPSLSYKECVNNEQIKIEHEDII